MIEFFRTYTFDDISIECGYSLVHRVLVYEIYSTFMPMGHTSVVNGKPYPHKSKIRQLLADNNIEVINIDNKMYITEKQLTDYLAAAKLTSVKKHFKDLLERKFIPALHADFDNDSETAFNNKEIASLIPYGWNPTDGTIVRKEDHISQTIVYKPVTYKLKFDDATINLPTTKPATKRKAKYIKNIIDVEPVAVTDNIETETITDVIDADIVVSDPVQDSSIDETLPAPSITTVSDIQMFSDNRFGSVRATIIDGKPWLVGKDVAEALGYSNASKAIMVHVPDDDKVYKMMDIVDSQNGNVLKAKTRTVFINESGMYALIFGSKLEQAKEFKHWVTSEVLPNIIKHGAYITDQLLDDPESLLKVVQKLVDEKKARLEAEQKVQIAEAARKEAEQQKAELQDKNKKLELTVDILKPKAEYADKALNSNCAIKTSLIAQEFGMKADKLNKLLESWGIQYKQGNTWMLTKQYVDQGYTILCSYEHITSDGILRSELSNKWTHRGRMFIHQVMKEHGYLPVNQVLSKSKSLLPIIDENVPKYESPKKNKK